MCVCVCSQWNFITYRNNQHSWYQYRRHKEKRNDLFPITINFSHSEYCVKEIKWHFDISFTQSVWCIWNPPKLLGISISLLCLSSFLWHRCTTVYVLASGRTGDTSLFWQLQINLLRTCVCSFCVDICFQIPSTTDQWRHLNNILNQHFHFKELCIYDECNTIDIDLRDVLVRILWRLLWTRD